MADEPLLDHIEVTTGSDPVAAVIWLHGLGASGNDFEPIIPELKLPSDLPVRFIFPHAPLRPVTINNGMVMRAWFDITGFDLGRGIDITQIEASGRQALRLVAAQHEAGIPTENIVLAGFSQGGAIALHAGLRHDQRLAGVMALSTFLPAPEQLAAEASQENRGLPVFYGHGENDPTSPVMLAIQSRDRLVGTGFRVEWHEYNMGHQVSFEEIGHISAWLQRVLR